MKIKIKIADTLTQLEQMAAQIGVKSTNNRIEIPSSFGKGFCQFYQLPHGIQLHHYSYCLTKPLEVESQNNKEDGMYIINLNLSNQLLHKNVASTEYWLSKEGSYGALYYSPGNNSRGISVVNVPFEVVFFSIPKSTLINFLGSSNITSKEPIDTFCRYSEVDDIFVKALMNTLKEQTEQNFFTRQGKLLQLLGELLQRFHNSEDFSKSSGLKMRDVEILLKVREILHNHIFGIAPTIDELAVKLSISKSKLKSDFKKLFGKTIYRYYLEKKMNIAHSLIKNKEGTIAEIGYRLGYSNISQFSSQFKKQYGFSPSETPL